MNTRHVCEFVEFAKTLNYTQTAKRLFISPTALTKHIHDLERDIGITLAASSGTVTTLTPAGKVFAQEAPGHRGIGTDAAGAADSVNSRPTA